MPQNNTSTKQAILYVRVSSEEQVDGTSLDFQESQGRKYCQENEMKVVAVFREEGASAKTAQRKEFLKAIEFCRKQKKKNPIEAFVVQKCDRFARNVEDHMMVRRKLLDFGTRLHSVSEPIDNSATGKMLETMMSAFAEFDNEIRRQRCIDGMSEKIKQGLWPWNAPCGYVSLHFRKRDKKKTRPDEPHPKSFPILQKGLKLLAQEVYKTQAQFARDLDAMGLAEIRGKKTSKQFILQILTEKRLKFYSGILKNPFNGNDYPGLHKAMISIDDANRIRYWLKKKRIQPTQKMAFNPEFPLRQLVLCASCGKGLTGAYSKGRTKRYSYYRCNNSACPESNKSIKTEKLEAVFENLLQKIMPKPEFWDWFCKNVAQEWKKRTHRLKNQELVHKNNLNRLREKKDRLVDMYTDGLIKSSMEFQEQSERIENEITATQISYSETRIENLDIDLLMAQAKNYTTSLGTLWRDLVQPEQRAKFVRFVFPGGIRYHRKSNQTNQSLGLIFSINNTYEQWEDKNSQKSDVVHLTGLPLNQIIDHLLILQLKISHS